jgi:hypothetical protein
MCEIFMGYINYEANQSCCTGTLFTNSLNTVHVVTVHCRVYCTLGRMTRYLGLRCCVVNGSWLRPCWVCPWARARPERGGRAGPAWTGGSGRCPSPAASRSSTHSPTLQYTMLCIIILIVESAATQFLILLWANPTNFMRRLDKCDWLFVKKSRIRILYWNLYFFKSFLADQIRFYDTLDEGYIYRRWGYLYRVEYGAAFPPERMERFLLWTRSRTRFLLSGVKGRSSIRSVAKKAPAKL